MPSRDLVEFALSSPMDWEVFESLAYDVLVRDDIPTLRKLGHTRDAGVDAVEESFFQDTSRQTVIVQITSQKSQLYKVRTTIASLRANGFDPSRLVVVFRQPLSSRVRSKIQDEGIEAGVLIDPRDQSYLVTQVAKHAPDLYTRYFDDIRTQVDTLLDKDDPLSVTPNRLKHALLASIGAFIVNPRARLARGVLFEKTVLAALVASSEMISLETLTTKVKELVPEESITISRVRPAVEALTKQGYCDRKKDALFATEKALVELGQILASSATAYEELLQYVIAGCRKAERLDDASEGYIERNTRRALLTVFRIFGLRASIEEKVALDRDLEVDLLKILSRDVGERLGRRALASLSGYVEDSANRQRLATFMRSYSALSIRNLDPLGRRWQEATLRRTAIALDTDAVLFIIIEELPEHSALLGALRAMADAGVRIVISPIVLDEAVGHLSRADRTLERFRTRLVRMSEAMVDAEVWNAVVRGFYYVMKEKSIEWKEHWGKYYDKRSPRAFVEFILKRRLKVHVEALDTIPEEWKFDLEAISAELLEYTERQRWKADYRDEEQKARRIHDDVRMAMHLSRPSADGGSLRAFGYLASIDRGFERMERSRRWEPRPKVLVDTRVVPELAEFACGARLAEDELVRLLFDPVIVAAAHLMRREIESLSRGGVDLSRVPLDRLEWDLSRELAEVVHELDAARREEGDEEKVSRTVAAMDRAQRLGYLLDSGVERVVSRFESIRERAVSEEEARKELEQFVQSAVLEAAGRSKKGKRRARRVLKELGLEDGVRELENEDDNGGNE